MPESSATYPDSLGTNSTAVVWEDEIWVLARHDAGTALGLTLHAREAEALGQLDDEHASQLGRIANRLVRILEHVDGAATVQIGRVPGPHVNATFEVAGVSEDRLHDIAVKLSNWGGNARS